MSPLPPLVDIRASSAPAVVILGNDAQLAARPATPVQLAHACLAAGFRAVVPASWGDELVAGATLAALAGSAPRPAIHCACPHVARRVLAAGSELAPHLVSLVAPPVAAARYLRLHSAGEIRITYVGRCPSAADDSIDARLTPEELLAQFADRGIDLGAQPEVFESVIPPDRRRHLSVPGGLPSPDVLWSREHIVVETIKGADFAADLAELVLAHGDIVIDAAPTVGCVCSGAVRGVAASEARATVAALEPPRSSYPVVEESGALALELPLPSAARDVVDLVAERAERVMPDEHRTLAGPADALGSAPPPPPAVPNRRPRLTPPDGSITVVGSPAPAPAAPPRRRSPAAGSRVVPGSVPVSSDSEGRLLPRAYVARRRSPRSGIPVVTESPAASGPPVPTPSSPVQSRATSAPRAPMTGVEAEAPRQPADMERPVTRSVEPTANAAHAESAGAAALPGQPALTPVADASPPVAASAPPRSISPAVDVRQPAGLAGDHGAATPASFGGARIAWAMSRLRRSSRLAVIGVIAGAGLLLGIIIGYSVAQRRPSAAASNAADRDSLVVRPGPGASGVRESVSAGGIAPVPNATRRLPRGQARTPVRGEPRASNRVAPQVNAGRASAGAPPNAASQPAAIPPANSPANPPAVTTTPDAAAVRARRDSIARADSLAAERESIRREIELRRARLDSIERARRRLDSLQRATSPASPASPPR